MTIEAEGIDDKEVYENRVRERYQRFTKRARERKVAPPMTRTERLTVTLGLGGMAGAGVLLVSLGLERAIFGYNDLAGVTPGAITFSLVGIKMLHGEVQRARESGMLPTIESDVTTIVHRFSGGVTRFIKNPNNLY